MVYRHNGVENKFQDKLSPDNGGKVLIIEALVGKQEERVSGIDIVDAKTR